MEDEIARAAQAKKGSPFLSTNQAAFYLGVGPRKLQAMRRDTGGPPFRRHGHYVTLPYRRSRCLVERVGRRSARCVRSMQYGVPRRELAALV